MRAGCVLALALVALTACKSRPSYDRSSPEATLESFFSALDKGRLPDDLPVFVSEKTELSTWRMRCRQRGCERGTMKIVEAAERGDYSATLVVDYEVFGEKGSRVMHGKRSPILFTREGDTWRIQQFGRRIPAPAAVARDAGLGDAAAPADAGPPADAANDD